MILHYIRSTQCSVLPGSEHIWSPARVLTSSKPTFGKGAPDIAAVDAGRHFFVEVMVKDRPPEPLPALLSWSSTTPAASSCRAGRGPEAREVTCIGR